MRGLLLLAGRLFRGIALPLLLLRCCSGFDLFGVGLGMLVVLAIGRWMTFWMVDAIRQV